MILGPRHWDLTMHKQHDIIPPDDRLISTWQQGFIDNSGVWLNRCDAWKIAEAAGQIIYRVGGDTTNGGTLYSENLY